MSKNSPLNRYKPASDRFEYREFPFYWIMRLGNRYTHCMETPLKQLGLNITMWRVAMVLRENGPQSVSEIATHAVAKLPTITKTVYKMQEQGLVEVRPMEGDGRVSIVDITEEGMDLVEQVLARTERTFEEAYRDLSSSEIKVLNQTLQKMFANLS